MWSGRLVPEHGGRTGLADRDREHRTGGGEQAEKDAATQFEVESPALEKWTFDSIGASRISQPVLYAIGGETLPLIELVKQHFQSLVPHTEQVVVPGVNHSMQMQDPKLVAAPIADFLSRHPL